MSRLNKVIAIKLAGQSDLGSNLLHLTTWVGRVLLSPVLENNLNKLEQFLLVVLVGILCKMLYGLHNCGPLC